MTDRITMNKLMATDLLKHLAAAVSAASRTAEEARQDSDEFDEDVVRESSGDDLPPVPANMSVQRCSTDLLVEVDLPGVRPEDVSVRVVGETLHVRGVRHPLDEYSDRKTLHDAVQRGPYEATLELNSKLDQEDLNAVMADGVLEVYIQDVFEDKQKEFDVPVEFI